MSMDAQGVGRAAESSVPVARRLSALLYRHPNVRVLGLLATPVLWLGLVYIAALASLLVTAFWSVNELTGNVEPTWTFENVVSVFTESLYRAVTIRTVVVAVLVTFVDIVLALPIAFFMARVASSRGRAALTIAVLTPLWASYLVKAYAWRSVLSGDGLIDWALHPFGLSSPGYGLPAVVMTLSYLWLPYVILPIYTAFERVPESLLEASSDLGARPWTTVRYILAPLIVPGVIAGSIFSFSLSLGDYIAVGIVGGKTQMLGNLVYTNVGTANNVPMAAAIALVPIIIIFVYLAVVRRTGALKNL